MSFTICFAIWKISFWYLESFKSHAHSFCFFFFAEEITILVFCILFLYSFHASVEFSLFQFPHFFFFSLVLPSGWVSPPLHKHVRTPIGWYPIIVSLHSIFLFFWCVVEITKADAPTIRMDATPSRQLVPPPVPSPPFLRWSRSNHLAERTFSSFVEVWSIMSAFLLPNVMYPMLSPVLASVFCSSSGGSLWLNRTCGACWYCRRPSLNSYNNDIQLFSWHHIRTTNDF